ncbi:MAG: ATPase domain-containing protein, partial [Patescibacteria group bacterium]
MKPSIIFACSFCDAQYTKWIGRCLTCGKWGTVTESRIQNLESGSPNSKFQIPNSGAKVLETKSLSDISGEQTKRLPTCIDELDRVLGGGLVPGSFILIGGEPGIGKSTLALQLAFAVPNTLYISGEESVEQIKLRADRLDHPLPPPSKGGDKNSNILIKDCL